MVDDVGDFGGHAIFARGEHKPRRHERRVHVRGGSREKERKNKMFTFWYAEPMSKKKPPTRVG